MTPCTCNTEMGDTCVKCAPKPAPVVLTLDGDAFLWPSGRKAIWPIRHGAAWMARADYTDILPPCQEHPTAEAAAGALGALLPAPAPTATPEPDRSGWPVLVRAGDDLYYYDRDSGDIALVRHSGVGWTAYRPGRTGERVGNINGFPTVALAAEALGARLPDEVGEAAQTVAPQPPPTNTTGDVWRRAVEQALGMEDDPVEHDAKWAYRIVLAIREEGNKPNPLRATVADLTARAETAEAEIVTLAREATELRETIEKQGEEIARLTAALQGAKAANPAHEHALALLDLAAAGNPALVHIAALLRL